MQRETLSSRAARIINLLQHSQAKLQLSIRRKLEGSQVLPLYNRRSGNARREISASRLSQKLIHLIPVLVLLCLFILWWFCYPVILEIKNGRIIAIHSIDTPWSLNETQVDLTILALTLPPYPSIRAIQTMNNDTAAEPVNIITD
ncbi:Protein kinase superfamily protein [Abeliophyllum distichum]|uniref:Protein kinase superfamily protein n=1 Tax=Abeliophyllum distichum TaxID=126358 RepID=A0ABD1Q2K0_9LAMI